MKLLRKGFIEELLKILITVCIAIAVANISTYSTIVIELTRYPQEYNLQTGYIPYTNMIKQNLKNSSIEKVFVRDKNVKGIQKVKGGNGKTNYYAVITYGNSNINVEIPDNLYRYIASNKIQKENVIISINGAEPKGKINGNEIILNKDAQITINITV